ncbi:beta-ketoacyl synthase chain length factor (plasmid) [Skermanella sp. TT6]|uniref:Beta-ketoacyl synthase chain length factor n=1 Tax=Skermanella cutis TaxID=2775420 RepID=A0ABX7BJ43_9PROT|nr:beta-ketoacyl synthase chain length factor [Skermanella sp. TT6]QQP93289.1 beta-ketoacyl synthase chain length factor [Skermanella sp. TT6]
MHVFVEGVGVLGPGLPGWQASRGMLAGRVPYVPAPTVLTASPLLPPAERRRSVPTVKLAMAVGMEAIVHAGRDPAAVATVFTSSSGDPDTIHRILETLASDQRELSPTRFHNSVHNAPAGYWSIATQSREPSTSLSHEDGSFQAGLLEAAAEAAVDGWDVALIAYDLPYPAPLDGVRRISDPFGIALLLAPQRTERSLARLDVAVSPASAEPTRMTDPRLESLRTGNPVARGLPLLAALARGADDAVVLPYRPDRRITIAVGPPCR